MFIDFSHYCTAGEYTLENLDLYADKIASCFDTLLQHTASIHVRISNGEQIQIPLNRIDEKHLDMFKNWWRQGLTYAEAKLQPNKKIPVVIELGPEDYQQKILYEGKWIYDCDRWEEALRCKALIESL